LGGYEALEGMGLKFVDAITYANQAAKYLGTEEPLGAAQVYV
jgi:hypothetical protein